VAPRRSVSDAGGPTKAPFEAPGERGVPGFVKKDQKYEWYKILQITLQNMLATHFCRPGRPRGVGRDAGDPAPVSKAAGRRCVVSGPRGNDHGAKGKGGSRRSVCASGRPPSHQLRSLNERITLHS